MARLNLAGVAPRSRIYGPGLRFVIWTQGCSIRCPGCWNTETWDSGERATWAPEILLERILSDRELEGITLLGGEPMDQADALVPLVEGARAAGLSVMTFTGYELSELATEARRRLADMSDLLVPGRFDVAQRDTGLLWRGSRNQPILRVGPRYRDIVFDEATQFEVVLGADGRIEARGFPPPWVKSL